jgi:S-DNA-T family DNA segregation ATPase FtsK/SpoIIIE
MPSWVYPGRVVAHTINRCRISSLSLALADAGACARGRMVTGTAPRPPVPRGGVAAAGRAAAPAERGDGGVAARAAHAAATPVAARVPRPLRHHAAVRGAASRVHGAGRAHPLRHRAQAHRRHAEPAVGWQPCERGAGTRARPTRATGPGAPVATAGTAGHPLAIPAAAAVTAAKPLSTHRSILPASVISITPAFLAAAVAAAFPFAAAVPSGAAPQPAVAASSRARTPPVPTQPLASVLLPHETLPAVAAARTSPATPTALPPTAAVPTAHALLATAAPARVPASVTAVAAAAATAAPAFTPPVAERAPGRPGRGDDPVGRVRRANVGARGRALRAALPRRRLGATVAAGGRSRRLRRCGGGNSIRP